MTTLPVRTIQPCDEVEGHSDLPEVGTRLFDGAIWVEVYARAKLPTRSGEFDILVFRSSQDDKEHVALVRGRLCGQRDVPVRVHSECLTGDVLGSLRCDCRDQLELAMADLGRVDRGCLLYMRQEGRGIGLMAKLRAYQLQAEEGLDTVEANRRLGFAPDLREYGIGAQILFDLGVRQIRLLTNNPRKVIGPEGHNLKIVERVPIQVAAGENNRRYLQTKRDKLGHLLDQDES